MNIFKDMDVLFIGLSYKYITKYVYNFCKISAEMPQLAYILSPRMKN